MKERINSGFPIDESFGIIPEHLSGTLKRIEPAHDNLSFNNCRPSLCTECISLDILRYMRQSIQEWTKFNLWKTAFKKFEEIWTA